MKRTFPMAALLMWTTSCGVNEVAVEIVGGDGNKLRLVAGQLEHKLNRLVDAGAFRFEEVSKGSYTVSVLGTSYLETKTLAVDSEPFSGVRSYRLSFELPPGSNLAPATEGTIVFASSPTKVRDWDLFTIKTNGSELTQLTDTKESEQHPSWSPDGEKILFTRGEVYTNLDVYAMNDDGSGAVRLTEHKERDERATWSPTGDQIAFVSQREGEVAVWIMNADGGAKRRLVQGREPSWSPDGGRIAFTSSQFEGNDEIYIIDADGTNLRRITDQKRIDGFPAWSPDGLRLAFNSERAGGQELMIAGVESGQLARITIAEQTLEQDPEFSDDGRSIVYQGKMNLREDGVLDVSFNKRTGKYRPEGSYDIFIVAAVGFDWDDAEERPIMPVNITNTPDRDEASPSWRAY